LEEKGVKKNQASKKRKFNVKGRNRHQPKGIRVLGQNKSHRVHGVGKEGCGGRKKSDNDLPKTGKSWTQKEGGDGPREVGRAH